MTSTDHLNNELSALLQRLSNADYRYSMAIRHPSGVVELFSSHQAEDQHLIELLQRIIAASPTPKSNYASSTQGDQNTAITKSSGVELHRAIESPYYELSIQDKSRVEGHIRDCLRELQQLQCKAIAKAWIKIVEPKKQSNYPYKNKELSKPPWWPAHIKHVEPDHLNMKERMSLIVELVLKTGKDIEALWHAGRKIGTLSTYQHALLDEIIFVARAERRGIPTTLLVSDWDNCSRGHRKEYPMLFKREGQPSPQIRRLMMEGYPTLESTNSNFSRRETSRLNEIVQEADITAFSDHDNDNNYLNPAISMEQEMKRCSLDTTSTSMSIGSLSLMHIAPEDYEHGSVTD